MAETELPIRVDDTPGGFTLRCLCGTETVLITPAPDSTAPLVRVAHGSYVVNRGAKPDFTPAGLLKLALHARGCLRGQNIARGAA